MKTITWAWFVGGHADGKRIPNGLAHERVIIVPKPVEVAYVRFIDGSLEQISVEREDTRYELTPVCGSYEPRVLAFVAYGLPGDHKDWTQAVWARFCAWREPDDWIERR